MKLELKENMYVRTKDGIIDKVIFDYNGHCASPNCECKHISCAKNYYDEDKVVKASYNIIDILEVGDYVNGLPIQTINTYLFTNEKYLNLFGSCSDWENEDITSVITHEQIEQISYRIGGKNENRSWTVCTN